MWRPLMGKSRKKKKKKKNGYENIDSNIFSKLRKVK